MKTYSGVMYSQSGRALGRWQSRVQLPNEDMRIIREFLIKISKQQKGENKTMPKTADVTNMCYIAGTIKQISTNDKEARAFLLVDVGENSKFIPCTIYDSRELTTIVKNFRKDDFIQLVGFARAWSQKKDDEWRNSMDIRITAVKNKPPERKAEQSEFKDDDIPF